MHNTTGKWKHTVLGALIMCLFITATKAYGVGSWSDAYDKCANSYQSLYLWLQCLNAEYPTDVNFPYQSEKWINCWDHIRDTDPRFVPTAHVRDFKDHFILCFGFSDWSCDVPGSVSDPATFHWHPPCSPRDEQQLNKKQPNKKQPIQNSLSTSSPSTSSPPGSAALSEYTYFPREDPLSSESYVSGGSLAIYTGSDPLTTPVIIQQEESPASHPPAAPVLRYHEYQFWKGWNTVSFTVVPIGVETLLDLYHRYTFFEKLNARFVFKYAPTPQQEEEWVWQVYTGTEATGEVPLDIPFMVRLDWASLLGVYGIENQVRVVDLSNPPEDLMSDTPNAPQAIPKGKLTLTWGHLKKGR